MGFTVIVVGGSVSGLSLANMLEKFNIDYVLLESHAHIAPQLGASMGLLPGGLRILDQLGCYDRLIEMAGDCYYQPSLRLFNGRILDQKKPISFSEKLEYKTGYPQVFIDRQMLLQVLFDNLESKDNILTRKRVLRVETADNSVHVETEDGSKYTGDIVVGADGVHSIVRAEMWRNGLAQSPGVFQVDEDKSLSSDSRCIFGISKRPASLPSTALQINAFFHGRNYMMLSAPGNRLYWFLFQNMDKVTGKDIPKFTRSDETELATEFFSDQISKSTTFGDVYKNRLNTALVPLEEHVFARWYYRRIITIGDAAHKVHPNTAQGGNGAIETSAVLLNALLEGLSRTPKPSVEEMEAMFAEVQASRSARAKGALEQGRHTSSISMKDTHASRLFVHFLLPWFGDRIIMWLAVKHAESGPVIASLPLPCRHGVVMSHGGDVTTESNQTRSSWGRPASGVALLAVVVYFSQSLMMSSFVETLS